MDILKKYQDKLSQLIKERKKEPILLKEDVFLIIYEMVEEMIEANKK